MNKRLHVDVGMSRIATGRNQGGVVLALALSLGLISLTTQAADYCNAVSVQAGGKLEAFDRHIQTLKTKDAIDKAIRIELCTKDNVFAFLTDEPAYAYGRCFVPASATDSFWNADHAKSLAMMQHFQAACVHWALLRYQPLVKRVEARTRRHAEQLRALKLKQSAEQERAKAIAEAKHRAEQLAQRESSRRQALQQAMQTVHDRHNHGSLQWSTDLGSPDRHSMELASYLLAADLTAFSSEKQTSRKHLIQHLNELLGKPRVKSVTATGKAQEYRVTIQSSYNDFSVDAFVNATQPPAGDATAWVLFEYRKSELTPVAAVLQTADQVLTAARLAGGNLPLMSLPDRKVTRLPASADAVQVQLRCVPHDGGRPMPLAHCLKPDGEINVLTSGDSEKQFYKDFTRKQRAYRFSIRPPFVLLARTGDDNRRGELQLKLIDTTQTDNPALFDSRAIARHDSLFVFSE